jgi:hypothetical protein
MRSYLFSLAVICVSRRDAIAGEAEAMNRLEELNPDYEKFGFRGAVLWAGVGILIISSLVYRALSVYRSSGCRPVRRAILASIRGPISSPS